jgi:signal transduction histidine kinase
MSSASRRYRLTLARKLALLTGVVIAVSLLIVLGVAREILIGSAIERGDEGLKRATHELVTLAETGIRQTRSRYSEAAHREPVRRALLAASAGNPSGPARSSGDTTIVAAQKVLAELSAPNDSGLPIELWNADGRRVVLVGNDEPVLAELPSEGTPLGSPRIPREGIREVARTDSLQIGHLYSTGNHVYYWLVMPVIDQGKAIGYIAHQRRIAQNPQADRSIRALAGAGVGTYYRNTDGTLWATLAGVPAVPSRIRTGDSTRAEGVSGEQLLIADEHINGTPLDVVMARSVRDVVAPARATLNVLLLVALVLLILGMGAALVIGNRVARPIGLVAEGAEAIARGQYDTRVPTTGDAEIARLAASFNHMANEVALAHQALEQQTADAKAANRAKSEFLATMSHELRTPLNAIAGYAELLEMGLRGPVTDAQQRDLVRIRSNGQHLLGLISSVLDLNRIERGQVAYDLTSIAIGPFLADLDALVSPQATAKALTLEYVPTDTELAVRADREKLRQIILNLLSNAIRFTPPGGRIRLSATPLDGAHVAVYIEDTGPGIPHERRDHVFEPFVQLDRSLTQSHGGLGLGLAISRDLARGMQGDLALDSHTRSGARFILTLPSTPNGSARNAVISGETRAVGQL